MAPSKRQSTRGDAKEGDSGEQPVQPPPVPTPLEEYLHMLRVKSPSITGRAHLVAWVTEKWQRAYLIATANSLFDLRSMAAKILPAESNISFVREKNGMISKICHGDSSKEGEEVVRMAISYGATLEGNALVFFAQPLGQGFSGLLFPECNVEGFLHTITRDGSADDTPGVRVFTKNQQWSLVLLQADVEFVMGLEGLPTQCWPAIMRELSNLRKKDTTYDITGFTNLAQTIQARQSADLKRSHVAFLDSLQSAFLEAATDEDKIAAFVANPSFSFLAKLQVKRPFSKPLFDQNGRIVKKVPLSSLSSTGHILLQNMPYDGNFYEKELKLDMPVYPIGDYQIKAGKNFKRLGPQSQMSAGNLRRLVTAKESSNTVQGTVTVQNAAGGDDGAAVPQVNLF